MTKKISINTRFLLPRLLLNVFKEFSNGSMVKFILKMYHVSEAFANICLNKDELEAEIGTWDLKVSRVTHIDLSNINYRFIVYKQSVWRSYGT